VPSHWLGSGVWPRCGRTRSSGSRDMWRACPRHLGEPWTPRASEPVRWVAFGMCIHRMLRRVLREPSAAQSPGFRTPRPPDAASRRHAKPREATHGDGDGSCHITWRQNGRRHPWTSRWPSRSSRDFQTLAPAPPVSRGIDTTAPCHAWRIRRPTDACSSTRGSLRRLFGGAGWG